MLISLNWLKDFVDITDASGGLPDPRELALRFTTTTAEVDGVEHREPQFSGLIAAKIESLRSQKDDPKLRSIVVDGGKAKFTSVTSAPDLKVGDIVAYAPPESMVGGQRIGKTDAAGRQAEGMIVAWGAVGFPAIGAHAIFLPPETKAGSSLETALFDDWIIEIDNKSITHRPDCWGHYGIAREVAAMLGKKLRPYAITPTTELSSDKLPCIKIEIDDPKQCPRYTALVMNGLKTQPAPLAMQVRLAMCGMRPISLLVDLTNYVMLELGQPMHAFDAARVTDIQVSTAATGEKFTTLDGVQRTMPVSTLMIQTNRKSVAIAGIMGGAATEVSATTQSVLLESATFDAATIRRAATAMGHRTEASARFEKSLDPANTVLGIGRFHHLAKEQLPELTLASTLSDCYPNPKPPAAIELDCAFASRVIGKDISASRMTEIFGALEFQCVPNGNKLRITPPSFRATKDISIEADLIEEVARFVGYNNIEPAMPQVTSRFFPKSPALELERRTLDLLCTGSDFFEVHDYIWYDDDWLKTLQVDPGECITLRNPAADNCSRLRKNLAPGLLAIAQRNRQTLSRFNLVEIGSIFLPGGKQVETSQKRCLGLLIAQQGKKADGAVWQSIREMLNEWASQVLNEPISFATIDQPHPWEDPDRLAQVRVGSRAIGRASIVPLVIKQRIDERLHAWAFAIAEIDLDAVGELIQRHEKLMPPPKYPTVQLDFSVLCDAMSRYEQLAPKLSAFAHPHLRRLSFVEEYEGGSIPAGKRSLTFRASIGSDESTLRDADIHAFQSALQTYLTSLGLQVRG